MLGDAQINIAAFNNGRTGAGADAICLVATDQPVSEPVLAQLRAMPNVLRLRTLRF